MSGRRRRNESKRPEPEGDWVCECGLTGTRAAIQQHQHHKKFRHPHQACTRRVDRAGSR